MESPGKGRKAFEQLSKFLHRAGKGVDDMKDLRINDLPGKGWDQLKKTGKAMGDHPRAAVGGAGAGIAGYEGLKHLLDDDGDDDGDREEMLRYIRGNRGGY